MNVSISPKARYPLVLALGIVLGCFFWETRSPWMGVEKFYRNTKLIDTSPAELGFPQTIIRLDLRGQSALMLHCSGEICKVRIVVFEREFDPGDRAILPNGYISFLREGVVLSDFRIVAHVGSVSRGELRNVFAEIRNGGLRRYKVERLVSDKRAARVLMMHFLDIPLRLRLRPELGIAEIRGSGLTVTVLASVSELDLAD